MRVLAKCLLPKFDVWQASNELRGQGQAVYSIHCWAKGLFVLLNAMRVDKPAQFALGRARVASAFTENSASNPASVRISRGPFVSEIEARLNSLFPQTSFLNPPQSSSWEDARVGPLFTMTSCSSSVLVPFPRAPRAELRHVVRKGTCYDVV